MLTSREIDIIMAALSLAHPDSSEGLQEMNGIRAKLETMREDSNGIGKRQSDQTV